MEVHAIVGNIRNKVRNDRTFITRVCSTCSLRPYVCAYNRLKIASDPVCRCGAFSPVLIVKDWENRYACFQLLVLAQYCAHTWLWLV